MARPSNVTNWPTHKAKARTRRRLRKNPTHYTLTTRTETTTPQG